MVMRNLSNPPRMEDIADIYPQEGFHSYDAMSVWCRRNGFTVGDYEFYTRVVNGRTRYYLKEWETPFL